MIKREDTTIENITAQHSEEAGVDAYTVDVHFAVSNVRPDKLSESMAEIIARVEDRHLKIGDFIQETERIMANRCLEACREASKNIHLDYSTTCRIVGEAVLKCYNQLNDKTFRESLIKNLKDANA